MLGKSRSFAKQSNMKKLSLIATLIIAVLLLQKCKTDTVTATATSSNTMFAVINEDKRPEIPKFVPPKFSQLIQDCWSRNVAQRPSLSAIIDRLKELKKEGLPRIELSLANCKLYRKKTTVFAFKSKDTVIVYKPWGTGESKKGDWVLVGPGDDVYTCDAAGKSNRRAGSSCQSGAVR